MTQTISASEFDRCMSALAPFEDRPVVAVGVSGGADSLALTLLAHNWAQKREGTCMALTVDHGLRATSAEEAQAIGRLLKTHGISHHILSWTDPKPAHNIQERARKARYALLTRWCRDHHVLHLLVGHHLNDQHETVAIRLERKTGLEGLAGMSRIRHVSGVRLLRPLLGVPKSSLTAYLQKKSIPWVEDPSNQNARFLRVKWRKALGGHENPVKNTSLVLSQLGKTRIALERWSQGFLSEHAQISLHGFVSVDLRALQNVPETFQEPLLSRILRTTGPFPYGPRRARLLALIEALKSQNFKGRTCHGCLLRVKNHCLYVYREPMQIKDEQSMTLLNRGEKRQWDHRFTITIPEALPSQNFPLTLKALGAPGWSFLKERHPQIKEFYPFNSMAFGIPSLWHGAHLIWTPALGDFSPDTPETAYWQHKVLFTPAYPLTEAIFLA